MQLFYKLGILLAMLLSTLLGTAQTKAEKLYDMYNLKDGITIISFSKSVIKPFDLWIDSETKKLLMDMDRVSLMVYNQYKGNDSSEAVYKRINRELKGGQYFEIDPNELDWNMHSPNTQIDNGDLKLIGHGKKDNMSEFHVVINDEQHTVLFSFFGKITIEDLRKIEDFSQSTKSAIAR